MNQAVAYLVNQYPHTSHSFIRREIAALESAGANVERISIRRPRVQLVDGDDQRELARTRVILDAGLKGLLLGALGAAIRAPLRFARAVRLAWASGRHSDRGRFRHLIYLAEACVLRRWLRRSGIQHVHAHFGTNSATVAMLWSVLGGGSYSFTAHGPEEFDRPEMLGLSEKIRRSRFVVAVSEFGRSQLYRWCEHEQWAKVKVVHCGLDERFLEGPLVPPPERPKLVCVGRICEQKGQLLLAEAAARLATAGVRFEIDLIGDGPMRAEVEELIREKGLAERVRVLGWRSGAEVREAILGARALVLPSFAEGLPVVLMESLALGRPVITTFVAGIPELVQDGRNGWLVPAGSVDALARAMREAVELPADRLAEMGRHGAAHVQAQHNAAVEAGKLADLFSDSARAA